MPDSDRGDGVDRGVLDPAVSDTGGARVQSVFSQRTLSEECAWTQERRIRLPVDPVSALGVETSTKSFRTSRAYQLGYGLSHSKTKPIPDSSLKRPTKNHSHPKSLRALTSTSYQSPSPVKKLLA